MAKITPNKIMIANRIEIAILLLICALTLAPLKLGFHPLNISAPTLVKIYYISTCLSLAAFQLFFMTPLKTFRVTNWLGFILIWFFLFGILFLWFSGADGRLIDFSNLEHGAILSPVIFAIGLPLIQAINQILMTNSVANVQV